MKTLGDMFDLQRVDRGEAGLSLNEIEMVNLTYLVALQIEVWFGNSARCGVTPEEKPLFYR